MWKKVLGKNRRFRNDGSAVLVESKTNRKFYTVLMLLHSGAFSFSQAARLGRAGENHLPLPSEMTLAEIEKVAEILGIDFPPKSTNKGVDRA